MRQFLIRGWRDESGTTAIEYALIAALISVGCIVGLTSFADSMNVMYAVIAAIAGVISP